MERARQQRAQTWSISTLRTHKRRRQQRRLRKYNQEGAVEGQNPGDKGVMKKGKDFV